MKFLHRIRSQFRKKDLDKELSEELAFHIQRETEENISVGMTPDEAHYAAMRKFGGIEQVKEECPDAWGLRFIDTLLQDLRFGVRMLRKNPGFAAVAVLTLALIRFAALPRLHAQKPEVPPFLPTFHTEVDLLSVAVRVTDRKGNEIHGLIADQFSLYEDGNLQTISFFDAKDEPVSLGILLDVSSSMGENGKLDHAKGALSYLISTMRPEDEMFYLQFHRQVDKVVDFTSDPHRILSAISAATTMKDGTSLYDSVATALCYMRSSHHHKRALLVVTDGADQNSHRSLEELIPLVQESQAQVFVIGCFGKEEHDLYRSTRSQKIALVTNREIDNPLIAFKRLADESGAESFFPSSDKIQDAVDAVAHQLRTQYTLAYYPSSAVSGFRYIKVKVAQSGARVRARRGFGGVEPAVTGGPPGLSAGCNNEQLKPYPYESKIIIKNGLTIYHDDFRDKASGWPSKEGFHYGNGAYVIGSAKHQPYSSPAQTTLTQPGPVGYVEGGHPAAGVLVANGPWFDDLNASVSVELKSGAGVGDMTAAAGLVFRLNARGYYAVIVSKDTPGSRGIAFKLVKKYHYEETTRDLLPWTVVPLADAMPGAPKKISVECRGNVITILIPGLPVTKFEDHSYGSFDGGLVGMVLYGTGRAVFRDLLAEEVGEDGKVPALFP